MITQINARQIKILFFQIKNEAFSSVLWLLCANVVSIIVSILLRAYALKTPKNSKTIDEAITIVGLKSR